MRALPHGLRRGGQRYLLGSRPMSADAAMKTSERSDEALMAGYQAGDPHAFRLLVERHHAPLYRFCLRALRQPEAASDATQEVFLRMVKNAMTWEPKAKVTTWMYTIARNFCIDESRKGRFRKTESLNEPIAGESSTDEKMDRVASSDPASDVLVQGSRTRKAIDDALLTLPEEQREVFWLREISGLSFQEIATITNTGENTVKSRMRYALGGLRKALQAAGFDDSG